MKEYITHWQMARKSPLFLWSKTKVLMVIGILFSSELNSNASKTEFETFCTKNKLNNTQQTLVKTLFEEANTNGFLVTLKKG